MNNEEFKKEFVEALKENLSERGNDVDVKVSTVEKMNQSYEAITITPEGSNIGMNMNLEVFAEAYESGVPFNEIVEQVTNKVEAHLADMPTFDVQALTDYEQMKDKLVMEVVATDRNADLLAKVPHQEMDYTAIGDTVNTAARLEANAPGGCVYVSRAVANALEGRVRFTSLGDSIKLKGKAAGFEVLRVEELLDKN